MNEDQVEKEALLIAIKKDLDSLSIQDLENIRLQIMGLRLFG